jgi:hypothetical protein
LLAYLLQLAGLAQQLQKEVMSEYWNAIISPLYFGAFWSVLGGLLICAIQLRPWKSAILSITAWFASALLAAVLARQVTGNLDGVATPLLWSILLVVAAFPMIRHLTPFALGMTAQRFYVPLMGIISLHHYLVKSGSSIYMWLGYCGLAGVMVIGNAISLYYSWSPLAELIRKYPRREKSIAQIEALRGCISRKVSIHVPCYAEPPALVIATLNAISRLRYSNFEVLVIDNNTKDPSLWKPVEAYCRNLGERFRFFHVDPISGAKAGALNFATKQTASDAEVIAVIDADYIAEPDFLERYMPLFEDPQTGFVQTTHDYRDWQGNRLLAAAYYEYVLNHKLTFPSFSEHDASFTVGTMCLLRREALEKAGGWAEWCLTEDSEVAVRIHAQGYTGFTFKDTAGRGLIPETMEGMKKQQFRWTVGPIQQFLRHWRLYLGLGGDGRLTFSQKVMELIHVSEKVGSVSRLLGGIPALAFGLHVIANDLLIPVAPPLLVLAAALGITGVLEDWTAVRRCGGQRFRDYVGRTIANNALQWTFISGFLAPLFKMRLTWHRTDKFQQSFSVVRALQASRTETLLALAHLAAAAVFLHFGHLEPIDYLTVSGVLFALQGMQFMCTLMMALIGEYELYSMAKNRAATELTAGSGSA